MQPMLVYYMMHAGMIDTLKRPDDPSLVTPSLAIVLVNEKTRPEKCRLSRIFEDETFFRTRCVLFGGGEI